MKLLEGIDYSAFLSAVQRCEGEVHLVTPEGDQLNLKSTLSQFIFAAAVGGRFSLANAQIKLSEPADSNSLAQFLAKEEN